MDKKDIRNTKMLHTNGDDKFSQLKKAANEYKKQTKLRNSKEAIAKDVSKRIRTTMIGALDQFEKSFGNLWGHGYDKLNSEQKRNKEIWEYVRRNILNNGNNQIRNFKEDLQNYDVAIQKHYVQLPVENYVNDDHSIFYQSE